MVPPTLEHKIIITTAIAMGGPMTTSASVRFIGELVVMSYVTDGVTATAVEVAGAEIENVVEYDGVGDKVIAAELVVLVGSISIAIERLETTVAS